MQTTTSRESPQYFDGLDALRERLPAYWWEEITRVRALIAVDAHEAFLEAHHFEFAAEEISRFAPDDGVQLAALTVAAAELRRIAWARLARA
jgi:hypothetical protein